MAKMKIFELKNQINEQTKGKLESKNIQDYLEKAMGVKKTHSSNLDEHEIRAVKDHFMASSKGSSEALAKRSTAPASQSSVTASGSAQKASARPTSVSSSAGQGVRTQAGQQAARTTQAIQGQQGNRSTGQDTAARGSQQPASQRPVGQSQVYHAGGTQRHQGNSTQHNQNTQVAHRPTGDNRSMGDTNQAGQGNQGQHSGQAAEMKPNTQDNNIRPSSQGNQGRQGGQSQAYHAGGGQRPAGEGGYQRNSNYQGQRPAGQGGQNRPAGEGGYQRNSNYQGQRPAGQGGQSRPAGEGGYQRNSNYQGQRPAGQGGQNRPAGEGGYQRNSNYQGQRPADGSQNRPAGEGGYQRNSNYQGQRPAGQGYQGQRPAGQGGQGYQGQRPAGQGYQGQRPAGQGYQGQRPAGQGYQGQRPAGQGYQGQRPAGQGYQGQRPAGQGYQGQRPAGQGGQGGYSRPYGNQGGGQRTGGYAPRGFEGGYNKDEDDKPSYGNRGQGAKKGSGGRGPNERKTFDQQILDQKVAEKNVNSNKRSRDRINKEKLYKDKGIIANDHDTDDEKTISKLAPRKGQFIQPKPVVQVKEEIKSIALPEVLTIKELSDKMKINAGTVVKKLFLAGKMVSINSEITYEEAEEIALEYDIVAEKEVKINEVEELLKEDEDSAETLVKRPPVICVMGHVDHGKTSLLDAIRKSSVTTREAGGITQHIGAYTVDVNGEKITFLDTPGHEAFTSMRMRGAQSTDIAILVVAADDGVMPQTVEAISHAKAAGVQIIVAINKIDKPSANIERVKQELTEYELIAEDWGGDTIFVPVSAHTREGISQLLEMILLTAEMAELKANPDRKARGLVIEAELDKGRGPVATILVQKGTLKVGDNVAVGSAFGKVRAMIDDKGKRVDLATPSTPVEILGLNEVPDVGEIFVATETEKEARTIAEAFITQSKERLIADTKAKLSLDGLFSQIQAGNIKELNLIIKADVQGSVEAMKQSLLKLSNDEVAVRVIHGGVGAINESDVILASTSNAIIIGFNVKPDNAAKETADREQIDIKFYKVIYNAIDDVEAAMKGMLDPIFEEKVIGHAEIRQTFKASGVGTIAGSYVTDGKIIRGSKARIYRDNVLIHEGILGSLKRFQDDVKEVNTGYECGLVFEKFNDLKEGDRVELYIMAEVPR